MLDWLKKQNPYAVFLWIVLGIPGISLVIFFSGVLTLVTYADTFGSELNPVAIFTGVVFMGPACLTLTYAFMGSLNDNNVGDFTAEGFVKGWGCAILATLVIFVIPALIVLGARALLA